VVGVSLSGRYPVALLGLEIWAQSDALIHRARVLRAEAQALCDDARRLTATRINVATVPTTGAVATKSSL
jgi:hypothetical protein